jgi:hypothetical protein
VTIHEYVEKAKKELDDMVEEYEKGNKASPIMWPLEAGEGEWVEQELAARF